MKNIVKLFVVSLIMLAGFVFFSCTDGELLGAGGGGNLNIVNIPQTNNGKFLEVTATGTGIVGTLTFKSNNREIIKSEKVKAPLYAGAEPYKGSGTLTVTVRMYSSASGGTPSETLVFAGIKFYEGSGLVNWPLFVSP